MHRNDADGFAPGNLYQEGAPGTGLLASKVGAKQLNTFQAEYAAVLTAAGMVPDDEDNAQLLAALTTLFSSGNAAAVLKNRTINGGFELWQRGTSIAVAGSNVFTADRWAANADAGGSGTATVSRQDFALGQPDVLGGPRHFLRYVQTVVAAVAPVLFQPHEDVARYSSGKITVSFWARASAPLNIATRCFQNFGTGGSATISVGTQAFALTTGWQRFSVTYTLPSVAIYTIGPLNFLRVGLSFPPALTFTVDVADFQVEPGENASAFDRRPLLLEYFLAARFFQKSYALDTAPGTTTRAGAVHKVWGHRGNPPFAMGPLNDRFSVPMRAVPTIAWYAPNGTAAPWTAGSGKFSTISDEATPVTYAVPISSTVNTSEAQTGYPVRADLTAEPAHPDLNPGYSPAWAHWTASAELVGG